MKMNTATFTAMMLAGMLTATADNGADFSKLTHHWNFDEGRDWHNMPFPFETNADRTEDHVGKAHLRIPGGKPNRSWVSGRQYSGVKLNGAWLPAEKNIDTLAGDATLSLWICTKDEAVLIGDTEGVQWGCIGADGRIGLSVKGKSIVKSDTVVTDNAWHHIVLTRNAATGEASVYVDGKKESTATGPKGKLGSAYNSFGGTAKGATYKGILDQIHVFSAPVNEATVAVLQDNHAPKIYDLEYLVDRKKATKTGSILHNLSFDVESDTLSVSRHGQGKHGKVKHNGDGTFTYTPGDGFKGVDTFRVEVTDGRGGYDTAEITVFDDRRTVKPAVEQFTYCTELPAPTEGVGKKQPYFTPVAIKVKGKQPNLVVQANNRLWYYTNKSKKGKIDFNAPVELKLADGTTIDTDGIAVISGHKLIVRRPDGILVQATLNTKETPHLVLGDTIKGADGADYKLPTRFFVVTDYNHDKKPDLVAGLSDGLYCYAGSAKKGEAPVFSAENSLIWRGTYNVAPGLGDLNDDGKVDLLHGVNWGTMSYWTNSEDAENMTAGEKRNMTLSQPPVDNFMRKLNGTHLVADDFDGDGTPDLIIGSQSTSQLVAALGTDPDDAAGNLTLIEKELYDGHETEVGRMLEENDQAGLKRYRELMQGWIKWAISRPTPAERLAAYNMLKKHVQKYDFLQRTHLKDAWVKKKDGKVTEYGAMHHVPGIFALNWVVMDRLMPDSAAHREDVADALGMKGTDREYYLATGIPLADNNKSSEGQLRSNMDLIRMHARILFPDDHISIERNFGDDRDAMCYVFVSNKNTFGCDVGNTLNEMDGDMVQAAERCLEGKGCANGDYYTFVLAHEVCHSLDAYVRSRENADLNRRWGDVMVYAATNAGTNNIIGVNEKGWWDTKLTQEKFKEKGLWDGKADWNETWKAYWKQCPYRGKTFMRGDIDWFLGSQQETLATQANHHWARSEARLIGAILRYELGFKANINEVVHYLDVLSAGLNKLHMYHPVGLNNPNRVDFRSDTAWLVRNDKGYITDVIIGDRTYSFEVNDKGRTVGIKSHPFPEQIKKLADEIRARKK